MLVFNVQVLSVCLHATLVVHAYEEILSCQAQSCNIWAGNTSRQLDNQSSFYHF